MTLLSLCAILYIKMGWKSEETITVCKWNYRSVPYQWNSGLDSEISGILGYLQWVQNGPLFHFFKSNYLTGFETSPEHLLQTQLNMLAGCIEA